MPAPIYLPQRQNPWELLLPQMVIQYMTGIVRNKFATDLLEKQTVVETQDVRVEEQRKEALGIRQLGRRTEAQIRVKQTPGARTPTGLTEAEWTKRKDYEQQLWEAKKDYEWLSADPKLTFEEREKIKFDYRKKLEGFKQTFKGTPETPQQKRDAALKTKQKFAIWHQDFKAKLPVKPEAMTPNQQRVLDQSLATAGTMILNNAESEAVKPQIAFVNKWLSKEPYIYTWTTKKGFFGDKGKAVRIDLPQGVVAADIKFTMQKERKTLNQVLRELGLIE